MYRISNLLTDEEMHYLSNLLNSGAGEVPDENGNVSASATHKLVVVKGFIVGAEKIMRTNKNVGKKKKKEKEVQEKVLTNTVK